MRGVGRGIATFVLGLLGSATAFGAESADPPLLPKFEGSTLESVRPIPGDGYALQVAPVAIQGSTSSALRIEGRGEQFLYRGTAGKTAADLYGHYLMTLSRGGFQVLFQCQSASCGGSAFAAAIAGGDSALSGLEAEQRYVAARLPRSGGDLYVAVYVGASSGAPPLARVDVVSSATPDPEPVSFTSSYGLKVGLDQDGHIALYDLAFEPDSSVLPLNARAPIQKIAQFLSENPATSVMIVSHTSSELPPERALAVTRARAQEIVNALVSEFGIAGSRLTPIGAGNAAPVTSPRTSAGRKLNERVEIVVR